MFVDSSGAVTDYYEYDAWGNLSPGSFGSAPNPFRWNAAAGYQHVPFTGLYHVGAREYDPRTARWLQRDPIDVGGGSVNLYLYCLSDPVNVVDESGEQPKRLSKADCEALVREAERAMAKAARELSYAKFDIEKEAVGGSPTPWGTTKPGGILSRLRII